MANETIAAEREEIEGGKPLMRRGQSMWMNGGGGEEQKDQEMVDASTMVSVGDQCSGINLINGSDLIRSWASGIHKNWTPNLLGANFQIETNRFFKFQRPNSKLCALPLVSNFYTHPKVMVLEPFLLQIGSSDLVCCEIPPFLK